jgi:hypothetical protein
MWDARMAYSDPLRARQRNWELGDLDLPSYGWDFSLTDITLFALACGSYGALHALAWNFAFRSTAEKSLWRVSAVYIPATGLAMVAAQSLGKFKIHRYGQKLARIERGQWECPQGKSHSRYVGLKLMLALEPYLRVLTKVVLVGCVLARTFLVVEALVALPHSPASVYKNVQWTAYLPHIA